MKRLYDIISAVHDGRMSQMRAIELINAEFNRLEAELDLKEKECIAFDSTLGGMTKDWKREKKRADKLEAAITARQAVMNAEIARHEAALAELTETHNDLLRCRDDQLPEILRENKRLEADIESRNNERLELARGIKKMQVALAAHKTVVEGLKDLLLALSHYFYDKRKDKVVIPTMLIESEQLCQQALSALAEGEGEEKR